MGRNGSAIGGRNKLHSTLRCEIVSSEHRGRHAGVHETWVQPEGATTTTIIFENGTKAQNDQTAGIQTGIDTNDTGVAATDTDVRGSSRKRVLHVRAMSARVLNLSN